MDKCPKCGGTSGYEVTLRVNGTMKDWHTWDGLRVERVDGEDGLHYHYPKTARCYGCNERIPLPDDVRKCEGTS